VVGKEQQPHKLYQLVVVVIIQQLPAQARLLLHLEEEAAAHKELMDRPQAVVVVVAEDF
jgi:hypothetical protein